ncbi:E3 ubiquitin-protein ligase TRIM34B-like [Oncorhynchus nerka]|uniref:E3 ubiquitin-protein ligase TRIM34B-like n=1 Tax=Oncorhynchus nerka TaxID=8023 RepID=UPI0031B8A687
MRRSRTTQSTRFPPPFAVAASTDPGLTEDMSEGCQALPLLDSQAIVCDLCTEDRKPAQKTCIKCEMSMCVQHLEPHLSVPFLLQTHTEPIAPGAGGVGLATKCPHHGKILEYYCLDDLTIVCMSCAIEDQHRIHNMKSLPKAHKELREKLKEEQKALAKRENQSLKLRRWDKEQRERLASSSIRLIEGVSALRDITLKSVQSSVSARVKSITTSKRTMQAALSEGDSFRFLQGYEGVHQAVEKARTVGLRKGLEPGADRDKLVQELQQSGGNLLEQTTQLWSSLLALVDPENHQEKQVSPGFPPTTTLTFDPKSLGRGMSLSQDHRKVFYTPLAKLTTHTLLCQDSCSDANPRWVVKFSEDCDWTVGVCDKEAAGNFNNGHVYALRWQKDQLSSVCTQYYDSIRRSDGMTYTDKPPQAHVDSQFIYLPGKTAAQPETIPHPIELEVFWDKTSPPSLSFYSRGRYHQRTELHRMEMEHHQGDLTPFVTLGTGSSPVSARQYREYSQPEQQWRCPCGEVHQIQQQSSQHQHGSSECKCERVIGTPYIEVFCQLV